MNVSDYIAKIKKHPDYSKAGMILCHNGVVRETSRNGKKVNGLEVTVDHEKLREVIHRHKQTPGIVDIMVEIAEGKNLMVGEDVMILLVAGDIRQNVITVLSTVLDEIKTTVTSKVEDFQ